MEPQQLEKLRHMVRRLTKGALLIAWIAFLLSMALLSWSGDAAVVLGRIWDTAAADVHQPRAFERQASSPAIALWQEYRAARANPPPVDAVFSVVSPGWTDFVYFEGKIGYLWGEDHPDRPDDPAALRAQLEDLYVLSFTGIADRLTALARDRAASLEGVVVSAADVHPLFAEQAAEQIALPGAARDWILGERQRLGTLARRDSLVDTFLLLLVLGAFGSLIFLSRDFMSVDDERRATIAAYVFRPVLGMFLGMAMFVLDVLAHSVISTAEMTEVRTEPLLILAFAAGLLSEQAYGAVQARAEAALARYRAAQRERVPDEPPDAG